jgi:DNA-binding transcriptional MerR regulator
MRVMMFRIGEFSHLARVSKRLLQFYDEIGLLKPARVDLQAGYRYYSARQLPRLNRILALKELGFSLGTIALAFTAVSHHPCQTPADRLGALVPLIAGRFAAIMKHDQIRGGSDARVLCD